jgi:hypothetical protein
MRGQTLEQYQATLAVRSGSNGTQAPRSRQVTGATAPGRSRPQGMSDQEREILDLMQ